MFQRGSHIFIIMMGGPPGTVCVWRVFVSGIQLFVTSKKKETFCPTLFLFCYQQNAIFSPRVLLYYGGMMVCY